MSIPSIDIVEEQACYALLMTQAMYRCGHKISSDSLINIAVQYYSSQGNADDKASALLYKGYILEDLGQDNEALYAYKQAEEAVKTVKKEWHSVSGRRNPGHSTNNISPMPV